MTTLLASLIDILSLTGDAFRLMGFSRGLRPRWAYEALALLFQRVWKGGGVVIRVVFSGSNPEWHSHNQRDATGWQALW